MSEIRYVQMEDKDFWFRLDTHISEEEFGHKVSRKMGYQDAGALVINISPYEQPMEMFLIKKI